MNTKDVINIQTNHLIPGTSIGRQPIVFVKGNGVTLEDLEGNKYIDCHGGYSAVNLGHCHPDVVIRIKEQAEKIWHVSWDYYLIPTALLAKKLANISPGKLNRVLFCSSGAEAVENAVKITKKFVSRRSGKGGAQIVSLTGSFHGRTSYALALTGQKKYKNGLSTYVNPGVVHAPAPYCYRCYFKLTYPECDLHCVQYMEDLLEYGTTGDVAAFISEPILGEGGIITLPDDYLSNVVKIFREHDSLFIADEVQTGFGRTGKLFGVEWFNVQPDVMTVAKGIASGLPIAATITTDQVAEVFGPQDHCSTFGGNALMCAAALENIDILLKEQLHKKASDLGRIFLEGLYELQKKHSIIGDVRGKGLMIGVELVKNPQLKTPAPIVAKHIREGMEKKGVLINVSGIFNNVLRLQPPLIITEEQVFSVLSSLSDCFKSI